ncbi:hypothetical protein FCIRC_11070 [Fusarium circinatum]|uniref:Uncharacterized protein n=1 Tax=Fusarium circinatum TaxID=48490 RepID=A0A8H5WL16_FUSCI|nr:hypothetical protein FCIRC_11070 [Fusarium circinatum]
MEVEGLRYVRSLSTRRLTKQDTLVYKARYRKRSARNRPEACLNIYYSEDHGGIRDVIITEDNELPALNMALGLSWSIFRHQATLSAFLPTLQFDRTYDARAWGVLPEHFDSFPRIPLAMDLHPHDRLYYESVRALDWNSPESAVSHRLGEPEPKARDEYGTAEETWFHMPIDPDEIVSELWLRKGMNHLGRREIEALIVRTTKGRTFTAGLDTACSDPVDGALKFTYKAIRIFPQERASRMFYYRANWMREYLMFEQQQQPGLGNKGDLRGVV